MINRMDGFIEEIDGDKYLNISDTQKNSEILEKYEEVFNGIRDCITKINDTKQREHSKN